MRIGETRSDQLHGVSMNYKLALFAHYSGFIRILSSSKLTAERLFFILKIQIM
jgi:hypothetical protein